MDGPADVTRHGDEVMGTERWLNWVRSNERHIHLMIGTKCGSNRASVPFDTYFQAQGFAPDDATFSQDVLHICHSQSATQQEICFRNCSSTFPGVVGCQNAGSKAAPADLSLPY